MFGCQVLDDFVFALKLQVVALLILEIKALCVKPAYGQLVPHDLVSYTVSFMCLLKGELVFM